MAIRDLPEVTDAEVETAEARMAELRRTTPHAVRATYDRRIGRVRVELSNGLELALRPRDVQGLETAVPAELSEIEISPEGFGLHFPRLDADLYVPGLLAGQLGTKAWMAARLGQEGGKARTPAKQAAARANGRLGGRPRKSA